MKGGNDFKGFSGLRTGHRVYCEPPNLDTGRLFGFRAAERRGNASLSLRIWCACRSAACFVTTRALESLDRCCNQSARAEASTYRSRRCPEAADVVCFLDWDQTCLFRQRDNLNFTVYVLPYRLDRDEPETNKPATGEACAGITPAADALVSFRGREAHPQGAVHRNKPRTYPKGKKRHYLGTLNVDSSEFYLFAVLPKEELRKGSATIPQTPDIGFGSLNA